MRRRAIGRCDRGDRLIRPRVAPFSVEPRLRGGFREDVGEAATGHRNSPRPLRATKHRSRISRSNKSINSSRIEFVGPTASAEFPFTARIRNANVPTAAAVWDGIEVRFDAGTDAFYRRSDWDWRTSGDALTEWMAGTALAVGPRRSPQRLPSRRWYGRGYDGSVGSVHASCASPS
jgi:hypothetical protein